MEVINCNVKCSTLGHKRQTADSGNQTQINISVSKIAIKT